MIRGRHLSESVLSSFDQEKEDILINFALCYIRAQGFKVNPKIIEILDKTYKVLEGNMY